MLLHMLRRRHKTGLQSGYMASRPLFAHLAPLIMRALTTRTHHKLGQNTPGIAGPEQHCNSFENSSLMP